jgi:hypothetical protein
MIGGDLCGGDLITWKRWDGDGCTWGFWLGDF